MSIYGQQAASKTWLTMSTSGELEYKLPLHPLKWLYIGCFDSIFAVVKVLMAVIKELGTIKCWKILLDSTNTPLTGDRYSLTGQY